MRAKDKSHLLLLQKDGSAHGAQRNESAPCLRNPSRAWRIRQGIPIPSSLLMSDWLGSQGFATRLLSAERERVKCSMLSTSSWPRRGRDKLKVSLTNRLRVWSLLSALLERVGAIVNIVHHFEQRGPPLAQLWGSQKCVAKCKCTFWSCSSQP